MRLAIFAFFACAVSTAIADPKILVYDANTVHGLALAAANQLSTQVTQGNASTFDGL